MMDDTLHKEMKEQIIRQLGIPWDEESERIELSANSLRVLARRYLRKDLEGKIIESPAQMFRRVAYHVAKADLELGGTEEDVARTTETFYEFLTAFRFMPNSPTFTGAGTPLGQLAACFTEDMRVVTDKGLKRIADLQVGDRVLTHKGRFRSVTETMQRYHEGDLYRIKVKLIGVTIEVTPEHPILTPDGWVEAKDLKVGDLVAVGVPQGETPPPTFDLAQLPYAEELEVQVADESVRVRRPSTYQNSGRQAEWTKRYIELTPELARLCGYYVAEGTIGPDERYVRFTFGQDEREYQQDVVELIEKIFGRSPRVIDSHHGKWTNVDVYSRVIAAWFREHFGWGTANKHLPLWLLYAQREIQEEFLVGLLRGDGMFFEQMYSVTGRSQPKMFRSFRVTMANPGLVHQVWEILLRLGYDAAIRPVDTTYVTANARETAQVSMPPLQSRELIKRVFGVDLPEPDQRYLRPRVHRFDGWPFFEIESIEVVPFSGVVYNCEVDEDHTYVTEGVVVHNCFVLPISDDMGKEPDGIFMTLRNAALIQQTGGGNGFSFSRLRPRGDKVSTSAGTATGPVGFLRVYDVAFGEIAQGGCLVPETLVFTEQGTLRLDEIVHPEQPGWQSHRLQVATDEGWRASPWGYNNGIKRVLRVRTSEGLEIVGTPDHKVKVMTADGPTWRPLESLQPGDAILVKLGQHRGQPQRLVRPRQQHGNQVMPRFPEALTEDLAFFLGYLIGDGFIARGDKDHRVGVTVAHSSYLMEEMPRLIRGLFGDAITLHRQQKADDASVTFVMDNRALKDFLLLNGVTKLSSREAFVPRIVRQSPPRVVGAFLRGLFEADGTLSHGYPSLLTTSERLAREVVTLLIGLGIPATLESAPIPQDAFGTSPRWRVRVVSHRGLEAWRTHVGCDPRSRFAAVCAFTPDTDRESSYPLPSPEYWLSPVLDAITLPQVDRQGRGRGLKFRATEPELRRQLLRYLRGDRHLTLSTYERLMNAYEVFQAHAPDVDALWFVHVTTVEDAGERLTLDLEVEENHTYLAWGMVTHNTRRGANMGVLRVDHPDIFDFIRAKEKEGELVNFNLSVGITDDFMRAVEEDRDFDLVNPRDGKVWRTVKAREIFDEIVRHAHYNGEPGALFLDTANRTNPLPHLYTLEATNPCFVGETRIATARGLIPIQELAESGTPFEIFTDLRAPWGGQGVPGTDHGTARRVAVQAFKTRENARVLRLRTKMGYTVVATPDHRFLTPDRGYVELQDLKPGDKVLLQSGEGGWSTEYALPNVAHMVETLRHMGRGGDWASGHLTPRRASVTQYADIPQEWSQDLGIALGWLVGDGWLSPDSNAPVGMVFHKPTILQRVREILRPWFGEGHVADRGSHYQLTYGRVPYEFFASLGVPAVRATEKRVPESIWRAPREAVVGFLQGLFSADGTVLVNEDKQDCTVRLASSSRQLLEDVQLLLLNFGIVSRIYTRRAAPERPLPDGHGGLKMYNVAEPYELVIGKANRDRFAHLIGFIDEEKQARLMAYIQSQPRGPYRERFEDVVEAVEDAGTADVYDLTEPETHSLIANGLVCHNCGEQFLGPYENCCLGSINLSRHVKVEDGRRTVDWDLLQDTVERAVHFLDNVVTANAYVPAVPQLKEAALKARRIGLGIMGLADVMYDLGIRYGSEEGQEFAAQVMEFIRYHAMRKSIELAKERGAFPAIKGSIYDPEDLKWRPPTWPDWLGGAPRHDWGRPPLDWEAIVDGIKRYGIRNAAQLTVAPTGTIATVSGCEGYGCEPVFALAYIRHFKDEDRDVELEYVSPRFMRALEEAHLDEDAKRRIVDEVLRKGTCQHIEELPEEIRHVFVVAQDITAEEHVRMQAALQVFVDNSISKCVVGDTLLLTARGLVPMQDLAEFRLPDQFEPLRLDVVSPHGVESTDAFYYGGMRETRKVWLQYGFSVEGTPNHRIHVLDESGNVVFRRLDELKPGDTVVLYSNQRRFGPGKAPLPRFSGALRTDSKDIRFPTHMSTDLAFFLGCVTSEGAITVNGVSISNTDRSLLEELQGIVQRVFGINSTIVKDSRNDVHYLQVNSRALRHWLLVDLGMEAGAANKIIPTCILQAGEEEIAAFLRGLFLDGYMTQDGRLFGIGLASERLLRQLQVLLLNFGVITTLHRSAENAWTLVAQGSELERLAEIVGFVEVWKNERLSRRRVGRLHRMRNYSRLLPPLITQALAEMQSQADRSLRNLFRVGDSQEARAYQRPRVNLLQEHRLNREDGRRLYHALREQGIRHPVADAFFAHDHDDNVYVLVEGVEVGFAEVFDISVPGSHTFIANGLGNHNTINFPETATVQDVADAYFLAWKLGCKGITVYVTGSREEVVLETREIKEKKKGEGEARLQKVESTPSSVLTGKEEGNVPAAPPWNGGHQLRPRPTVLSGRTYRRPTPVGTAWITVNNDEYNEPFEVFLNVGKAGSDVAADSEALGRLISLILRLPSPLSPRERLEEVIHQLSGIGGGRSMGFGAQRVRSLPDAIAQVLRQHLEQGGEPTPPPQQLSFTLTTPAIEAKEGDKGPKDTFEVYGDICPECGQATLIPFEGCKRCTNCGYSEC